MGTIRARMLGAVLAAGALTAVAAPAYAGSWTGSTAAPSTSVGSASVGSASVTSASVGSTSVTSASPVQVLPVPVRLSRPGVVLRWSCTGQLGVSVLAQQASPTRAGLTGKGYLPLTCDGTVHRAVVPLVAVDPATPFLTPGTVTLTAVTSTGATSTATTFVRGGWSWRS